MLQISEQFTSKDFNKMKLQVEKHVSVFLARQSRMTSADRALYIVLMCAPYKERFLDHVNHLKTPIYTNSSHNIPGQTWAVPIDRHTV